MFEWLKSLVITKRIKTYYFLILVFCALQLTVASCPAASKDEVKEEEKSPPASATVAPLPLGAEEVPPSLPSAAVRMPFKLGFEFQEIGGLCSWALYDIAVQKKPLFEVLESKPAEGKVARSLWHVVIDTNDIEFVTPPFADTEEALLRESITTLTAAFESLRTLLGERESVTFNDWTGRIPGVSCLVGTYRLVHDKLIAQPAGWVPTFAPQVTLQHPLEWTVPLYFGLFGFKCTVDMMNFCASLPYRNFFLRALNEEGDPTKANKILSSYWRKLNGLVFLHALTLVQMTPTTDDDSKALQRTYSLLKSCHQIDAKMMLALMSRRPFSAMYEEIRSGLGTTSYEEYFVGSILRSNTSFTSIAEVPRLFGKTNYGEQFVDEAAKTPLSLERFSPFFEETFFAGNKKVIEQLLKEGVVTTTMIRHVKGCEPLLAGYFREALNISGPTYKRYALDVTPGARIPLKLETPVHDALSPPWFLDLDDSMGRFKDPMAPADKKYGEAVIEVRAIRNVGPWFLRKTTLERVSEVGDFLTRADRFMIETTALFNFLKTFTSDDFGDINIGMTYAIAKY